MDSFETIVSLFLEDQRYWVKNSVRANISKSDKRKIGLPSMPRPEVDLVAFKPGVGELVFIEAKSLLDSPGVNFSDVAGRGKGSKHYKLFTSKVFREVVTKQIIKDFKKVGLIFGKIKVMYALAAGKIKNGDQVKIQEYFDKNNWRLYTPEMIRGNLKDMAKRGYENHPVVVAVKMILRS